MRLLLLILSLILTFTSVHGNGSISPICDVTSTIRPIHPAGAKPATAASSQSLQPSAVSYTPNTAMTITITGTVNGLVIYARDSTGTHVGRWTAATGTQLITCTGINAPRFSAPQGTTLSHSNSNAKTNLRLTWTSPAMANGPITFQGMFTNGDAEASIYLFNDVTIMPPPEPTQPPPVITQPPPIGPVGPTGAPVIPQSPTGVVASAGNGLITIQFTPPRDNGGSPILGYTVSVISPPNSNIKSESRNVPPIFFLVTNDIPYVFSIVATNAIGSSQAITTMAVTASDTISVASAPTNVQVIPGNGQATVS